MLRSKPQYWYGRFLVGVVLILLAGMGRIPAPLSLLVGIAGFFLALQSIGPVVRLLTRHVHANSAWNEAATNAFARASLPRRIYYLLAAVAEVDGPMSRNERETVRHFVIERFSDPVHSEEVRSWEAQPLQLNDRVGLAARIATGLNDSELDTLFCWPDSSLTTTFIGALVATPVALVAALPVWTTPSLGHLLPLIGIATISTLSNLCRAQALKEADITVVAPFEFLKLPWVALIGYAYFAEVPDIWTWIGGAVIFVATTYIAYRERHIRSEGSTARSGVA